MKAQGIISDILLNVRRGKCHFTFHELLAMTTEYNPSLTWDEFKAAVMLTVLTGEVKSSVPIKDIGTAQDIVSTTVFSPGKSL